MGNVARIVDWTQEDSEAPRALDSGICLRALESDPSPGDEDVDFDTPTRPYERVAAVPANGTFIEADRCTSLAVARLRTLNEWLSAGEDTAAVVMFVRSFLSHIEELNFAIGALRAKLATSSGLGEAVEAFSNAASVWRVNLVDYVDDLALTQHASLDAWSSLPEYSSTYVLAFIAPTLGALKEAMTRDESKRAEHLPCAWAVEASIVRLNWMLAGASLNGAEDAKCRETMPASGW